MKKIVSLFTVMFFCIICYSQETRFTKESGVISSVIGWGYDPVQEVWLRCKNHIENNKLIYSFEKSDEWISHDFNNIISLQFKSLYCGGETYYVMVWEKFEGKYKYPETYEGWEYWRTKMFLLFSENEFKALSSPTSSCVCFHAHTLTNGNAALPDIDVISKALNYSDVVFAIKETPEGMIRFNIKRRGKTNLDHEFFEISTSDFIKLISLR